MLLGYPKSESSPLKPCAKPPRNLDAPDGGLCPSKIGQLDLAKTGNRGKNRAKTVPKPRNVGPTTCTVVLACTCTRVDPVHTPDTVTRPARANRPVQV